MCSHIFFFLGAFLLRQTYSMTNKFSSPFKFTFKGSLYAHTPIAQVMLPNVLLKMLCWNIVSKREFIRHGQMLQCNLSCEHNFFLLLHSTSYAWKFILTCQKLISPYLTTHLEHSQVLKNGALKNGEVLRMGTSRFKSLKLYSGPFLLFVPLCLHAFPILRQCLTVCLVQFP